MWTSDNLCVARWVWNELNLLSLGRHDLFCVVNHIQMETASRLGQHCDRSMIEDRVEDLLKKSFCESTTGNCSFQVIISNT